GSADIVTAKEEELQTALTKSQSNADVIASARDVIDSIENTAQLDILLDAAETAYRDILSAYWNADKVSRDYSENAVIRQLKNDTSGVLTQSANLLTEMRKKLAVKEALLTEGASLMSWLKERQNALNTLVAIVASSEAIEIARDYIDNIYETATYNDAEGHGTKPTAEEQLKALEKIFGLNGNEAMSESAVTQSILNGMVDNNVFQYKDDAEFTAIIYKAFTMRTASTVEMDYYTGVLSSYSGAPSAKRKEFITLFATMTSADVPDSDGDGFSDGEEAALETDPLDAEDKPLSTATDSDGDGLSDTDEASLGTGVNIVDSDSDGFSDGKEKTALTDALDNTDHPQATSYDSDGDGIDDIVNTGDPQDKLELKVPQGALAYIATYKSTFSAIKMSELGYIEKILHIDDDKLTGESAYDAALFAGAAEDLGSRVTSEVNAIISAFDDIRKKYVVSTTLQGALDSGRELADDLSGMLGMLAAISSRETAQAEVSVTLAGRIDHAYKFSKLNGQVAVDLKDDASAATSEGFVTLLGAMSIIDDASIAHSSARFVDLSSLYDADRSNTEIAGLVTNARTIYGRSVQEFDSLTGFKQYAEVARTGGMKAKDRADNGVALYNKIEELVFTRMKASQSRALYNLGLIIKSYLKDDAGRLDVIEDVIGSDTGIIANKAAVNEALNHINSVNGELLANVEAIEKIEQDIDDLASRMFTAREAIRAVKAQIETSVDGDVIRALYITIEKNIDMIKGYNDEIKEAQAKYPANAVIRSKTTIALASDEELEVTAKEAKKAMYEAMSRATDGTYAVKEAANRKALIDSIKAIAAAISDPDQVRALITMAETAYDDMVAIKESVERALATDPANGTFISNATAVETLVDGATGARKQVEDMNEALLTGEMNITHGVSIAERIAILAGAAKKAYDMAVATNDAESAIVLSRIVDNFLTEAGIPPEATFPEEADSLVGELVDAADAVLADDPAKAEWLASVDAAKLARSEIDRYAGQVKAHAAGLKIRECMKEAESDSIALQNMIELIDTASWQKAEGLIDAAVALGERVRKLYRDALIISADAPSDTVAAASVAGIANIVNEIEKDDGLMEQLKTKAYLRIGFETNNERLADICESMEGSLNALDDVSTKVLGGDYTTNAAQFIALRDAAYSIVLKEYMYLYNAVVTLSDPLGDYDITNKSVVILSYFEPGSTFDSIISALSSKVTAEVGGHGFTEEEFKDNLQPETDGVIAGAYATIVNKITEGTYTGLTFTAAQKVGAIDALLTGARDNLLDASQQALFPEYYVAMIEPTIEGAVGIREDLTAVTKALYISMATDEDYLYDASEMLSASLNSTISLASDSVELAPKEYFASEASLIEDLMSSIKEQAFLQNNKRYSDIEVVAVNAQGAVETAAADLASAFDRGAKNDSLLGTFVASKQLAKELLRQSTMPLRPDEAKGIKALADVLSSEAGALMHNAVIKSMYSTQDEISVFMGGQAKDAAELLETNIDQASHNVDVLLGIEDSLAGVQSDVATLKALVQALTSSKR
ncbi:MAG: hypothetical protein WCT15_05985, partial [Candidatus Omnitrophota bacterium]